LFFAPGLRGDDENNGKLTEDEFHVLNACKDVIQLFEEYPDSVWPGYDLSEQPFIVYVPEKWALLINYSKEADGFKSYPDDWPKIGENILYHEGQFKDLAGQLAFYLSVDTIRVAAVGFHGHSESELFKFIVHEVFHQYQYENFGEIPWEREQKYPIQDRENTALACLEMRLLMDALEASKTDNRDGCIEYLKQFVSVRDYRWKRADPFVPKYERGKELSEGSAKYVESKSFSLLCQMKHESIAMTEIIIKDMNQRFTGNSISPEDVPRNRIYPVGGAQAFLLDYLNIDWKDKARQAGPGFTYSGLFKKHLETDENQFGQLLESAKINYNYDDIVTSADTLITLYIDGFSKTLESFESQSGYRMEIELKSSGLSRSRHSRSKKWVVDEGARELCGHFNVYSLKNDDLLLQINDTGLLEENDWDKKIRKVVFFVPEVTSVILDGEPLKPADGIENRFDNIEISGRNLKFEYSGSGTVIFANSKITINLVS
jgi:hypothetical protein